MRLKCTSSIGKSTFGTPKLVHYLKVLGHQVEPLNNGHVDQSVLSIIERVSCGQIKRQERLDTGQLPAPKSMTKQDSLWPGHAVLAEFACVCARVS